MKFRLTLFSLAAVGAAMLPPPLLGQQAGAPEGIRSEQLLPERYSHVVSDVLKHCEPAKGFWIDLGAGQGQLSIPLAEATGNPVVMVDPDAGALAKALARARDKGLSDRLFAVAGVAEALPFPDNSADLVVSRGAIFFFADPVKGLQEVHRVLRPGGKAYIGGGAGSGYPKEATAKLIQNRKDCLKGDDTGKWQRFVALRSPEQMKTWAEDAGLTGFEVMGEGALAAGDARVGQGVWLRFTKQERSLP